MGQEFKINPANLKISNLLPDRPMLGNDVSVVLWRLVRIVGLYQILGEETPTLAYFTGKQIGKMLEVKSIREIQDKLTELKVGKIEFPVVHDDVIHLSIGECATCVGISPILGMPICQLEAGIVVGALEMIYPDKKVSGIETKCIGGLGDDVCLVECQLL